MTAGHTGGLPFVSIVRDSRGMISRVIEQAAAGSKEAFYSNHRETDHHGEAGAGARSGRARRFWRSGSQQ
jgi:hypothetical protein